MVSEHDAARADPSWEIGKHGLLVVRARQDRARTVLEPVRRRIPFQWHGVHYQDHDAEPFLLLHSSSGGFVEGDSATIEFEAGTGTRSLLTTTEATKFYRCDGGGVSRERNIFHVGPEATVEYLPDEVIPFARSRFDRCTSFHLHPTSQLIASEIVTAGRVHYRADELFGFDAMTSALEIRVDGRPRFIDRLVVDESNRSRFRDEWDGFAIYATVVAYGAALTEDLPEAVERDDYGTDRLRVGASFRRNLLVVRILGDETWRVHEAVQSVWSRVRPQLLGKPARPIIKC